MWTVMGELVPTPGEEKPFKVVFRNSDFEVLEEIPVASEDEGYLILKARLVAIDEREAGGGKLH
jgi:hypothetical protein